MFQIYQIYSLSWSLWTSKDLQEVEEQVDDVQVEVEGGKDVLLRAEAVLVLPPHHDLSVVDQVDRKDQATTSGVTNIGSLAGK